MTLKAIIFDMDGVLIDSMKFHIDAWKMVCDEENINLTKEQIALNEGLHFKDTIKNETRRIIDDEHMERIFAKKHQYMKDFFKLIVYDGVSDFIKSIRKRNIKMALVTGSIREFTASVVEENFKDCFDVIVTSSDVALGKPHPEPYLKAIEMLGFRPNECIVIENSPHGIASAKSAFLTVYAIGTTLDLKYLERANKVFKNHEELFEDLENLCKTIDY
jgi:beta-phosphoglucomutase